MPNTTITKIKVAVLEEQMKEIKEIQDQILTKIEIIDGKIDCLDEKFVTLSRFSPIEKIVYGICSVIGLTILGYALTVIFSHKLV